MENKLLERAFLEIGTLPVQVLDEL